MNEVLFTPCHLIAGPLGVGKTTAILEYLKHKTHPERIAVLVNDFGESGLDAAILGEEGKRDRDDLCITPVPGGCLCCTSAIQFTEHLELLANDETIDRILIEPSGLVMLGQMKALLQDLASRLPLLPQPITALINAAKFNVRFFSDIPYFKALGEEADILVANRCDQATTEQIKAFTDWAQDLGEKQVITTRFGRLPQEIFSSSGTYRLSSLQTSPLADHQEDYCAHSREWRRETLFDAARLEQALRPLAEEGFVIRLKAVLRTDQGWRLIEIAQGEVQARAFPVQQISRVDWIAASTSDQSPVYTVFKDCIKT